MRPAANAILASVAGFLGLAAIAVATYPGGSWLDLNARSHDFLRNFLCDLLGPKAINGQPNPVASIAMRAAMILLAIGLTIGWWSIPNLFSGRKLRVAIRVCACLSLLGLLAVPLTPPTVSYALHAAAAFSGGIPGATAWILSVIGLFRAPQTRRLAWFGGFALVLVLIGFVLYALQLFGGADHTLLLPVSHRVATFFFLAWLVAVGARLRT